MFSEEKHILPLIKKFLSVGCDVEKYDSLEFCKKKLKCYFKKDENNCLCIYDNEFSIKCIFDKKFLEDYFESQPSYINIDSFDSTINFLKKFIKIIF